MRKFIISLLVVILISSTALASESTSTSFSIYEGPGCSTAEEAVLLYLDGLKSGDLPKMLSAFAIETYVKNFDFTAQLKRLQAYIPSMPISYPNANNLMMAINVESRKQDIVNRVKMQFVTLCMPDLEQYTQSSLQSDDEVIILVNQLQDGLNGVTLQNLQFTGFIAPSLLSEIYNDERTQDMMNKQSIIYGADELCSVVALFSIDETPYIFCCNALRYNDNWYLESLSGHIGAIIGLSVASGGIAPAMDYGY